MMRALFQFLMSFLLCAQIEAQQRFQLAPPLLDYASVFFKNATTVKLKFAQSKTKIYYTTNGAEPTAQDKLFQKPIRIRKKITTVKAKTFGTHFLPSETAQATFIKEGLKIRSATALPPDENHTGTGSRTLFDGEGGIADMHSKAWLGYRQDSIQIIVMLEKKKGVRSVLLNFLQDEGSWIFLPQQILVFYYDDRHGVFKKFMEKTVPAKEWTGSSASMYQLLEATKGVRTNKLKIIMKTVNLIPEGHPGNGQQSWVFIDEIKVY